MRSLHADAFNHDEYASDYDADVLREEDPIRTGYADALEWTASFLNAGPQSTVCDLGSGTGNLTARLPRTRRLYGVDVSRAMSARARSKLGRRPDVEWVEDDLLAFVHRDDLPPLDAVGSTYALHHLADEEKTVFFGKVRERLGPGGAVAFADLMFADAASRGERLAGYRASGRGALADEIEAEFFWDLKGAEAALRSLGFATVTHRFSDLSWGLAGRLPGARPKIKVCCITSVEEAEIALRAGADALGLVSSMPSGPGVIEDAEIARIARGVGGRADTVLLTCRTDPAAIAGQVRAAGVTTVQLCDRLPEGAHAALRAALPDTVIIGVVHVAGEGSIAEAEKLDGRVDAILLDSGRPDAAELGGTGRVHDWAVSRRIREVVAAPVYLAGGLTPDNVAHAAETVAPYGLDACSGLRENGRLCGGRLASFFARLEGDVLAPRATAAGGRGGAR